MQEVTIALDREASERSIEQMGDEIFDVAIFVDGGFGPVVWRKSSAKIEQSGVDFPEQVTRFDGGQRQHGSMLQRSGEKNHALDPSIERGSQAGKFGVTLVFLGGVSMANFHSRHVGRSLLVAAVASLSLYSFACSGDIQDKRSTTGGQMLSSSSGGGGEGVGGMGGAGGSGGSGGSGGMGAGGAPIDGGGGDVEYVGYNLFTHVPRFVIFKIDHARNLCFRIWVEGFSGPGPLMIQVNDPWVTSRVEVTNNISDCTMTMGFPPQPQNFSNATAGTGTLMVPGSFPCAVDLHAKISFDTAVGAWVPANEPFDVDMLTIDGGCG